MGDDGSVPPTKVGGAVTLSDYIGDGIINPHPRFATLSANIRQRRGEKVNIRVPLFRDTNTPEYKGFDTHSDSDGCCGSNTLQVSLAFFGDLLRVILYLVFKYHLLWDMHLFDLRSNTYLPTSKLSCSANSYGDMERATSLGRSTAMITSWLVARHPIKGPVQNSMNPMAGPRLWPKPWYRSPQTAVFTIFS